MFCSRQLVLAVQIIIIVKSSWVPSSGNLAFNKPTRQSTTETGNAQLVVNGVYSDFSETATEQSNWWMVDLLRTCSIGQIQVHGRKDCCADQFSEVTVLTTEELRPPDPALETVPWVTRRHQGRQATELRIISFLPPIMAQHVAVHRRNNYSLALSEVEVFDFPADNNLARGKTAQQSGGNESASLAVNGIYDDFTLTTLAISWWKVDLGALHQIQLVILYNRLDCCHDNLHRFRVRYTTLAGNTNPKSRWESLLAYAHTFRRKRVLVGTSLFHARQIGVVTGGIRALSLAEVEVYAPRNLAFQKTASQWPLSSYSDPKRAVDAIYSNQAKIISPNNKRWAVDLGEIYTINHIDVNHRTGYSTSLEGIEIFISKQPNSIDLSIEMGENGHNHTQWDATNRVHLKEARHVIIQNTRPGYTFNLAEVVVSEFDYAYRREASQSSVCEDKEAGYEPCSAARAVDNDLSTFSKPNKADQSAQWWKVSLGKVVKFRLATIFGINTERCLDSDNNEYICSKQIAQLSITTILNNVSTLCFSGPNHNEKAFIVQCNRNRHQPIMEQFQINMNITEDIHNLELAQVEVFAKELPQLTLPREEVVSEVGLAFAVISFLKWHHREKGCLPPTKYKISLHSGHLITLNHNENKTSNRLSVRFEDLNPGQGYKCTIKCEIENYPCPGPEANFQIRTDDCTKPGPVVFKAEVSAIADNSVGRRNITVTIDQVESHNCLSMSYYNVSVKAENGTTVFSTSRDSHGAVRITGLVIETSYSVRVTAQNNLGLTSEAERTLFISEPDTTPNFRETFPRSTIRTGATLTTDISHSQTSTRGTATTVRDLFETTTAFIELDPFPVWKIALVTFGTLIGIASIIAILDLLRKIKNVMQAPQREVKPQIYWEPPQSTRYNLF